MNVTGEQDRRDYKQILNRREEESAKAALSVPATVKVEAAPAPVNPYEHIRTPDETKGVAGGWTTVAVRDVKPEPKVSIERLLWANRDVFLDLKGSLAGHRAVR